MNSAAQSWKAVSDGVSSGEFRVDPDTGSLLHAVLERHLRNLEESLRAVRDVAQIAGFGAFPHSGQVMEGKYSTKAINADNSLRNRLQQHVGQVKLMMSDIKKMMGDFAETDESNRRSIEGAMPS